MKQDQSERKRKEKLDEKLSSIRAEDRKKSKEIGKKPFYLKKSTIKEIALEQRYVHTPTLCISLITIMIICKVINDVSCVRPCRTITSN